MTHRVPDRVFESFTTEGAGNIFFAGAAVSQCDSVVSAMTTNGDTMDYAAFGTAGWEEGLLTRVSATEYSRSVKKSSNANAAVTWTSGTKYLISNMPGRFLEFLNQAEITVADSGTPDIGAVQGGKILLNGTTTITSFGTSPNKLRLVRFGGARTLTYNATSLILPGAANITTVAGDTALFVSDASGNWRCLFYQVVTSKPKRPVFASQVFTASGTFTTPADSTAATVYRYRLLGPGGGGGGTNAASAGGGGGGAGAYAEGTFTGVAPSTGITITIGTGGAGGANTGGNGANGSADSSIGSPVSITAGKGSGGLGSTSGPARGGAGGTISGSPNIVSKAGQRGSNAGAHATSEGAAGNGASTPLGEGGVAGSFSVIASDAAATGYGAGGGGAVGNSAAGSAGTDGICIIDWVL